MNQTIALIEIQGYIASIETVDAMVKSASVQLIGYKQLGNEFVLAFTGERKTILAALELGIRQARNFGTVLGHHVINMPDNQTQQFIESLMDQN